jgi:hypothetical protein
MVKKGKSIPLQALAGPAQIEVSGEHEAPAAITQILIE